MISDLLCLYLYCQLLVAVYKGRKKYFGIKENLLESLLCDLTILPSYSFKPVYQFAMAPLTKYPKLTGFDSRNAVSHSCEGQMCDTKLSACVVSSGAVRDCFMSSPASGDLLALSDWQTRHFALCLHLHVAFSLCACLCVHISFLFPGTPVIQGQGPL